MDNFAEQPLSIDVDQISQELRIRPQIYLKLVKSFSANLIGKLKLLHEALTLNDRDHMRMILHEIKGTAGNLRLHNVIGPEAVLHNAVKAGVDQKILEVHFEILRSECERLQRYLSSLPTSE